jgi:ubiquinone/menaquinone biosynthesis C-methylase UbiE
MRKADRILNERLVPELSLAHGLFQEHLSRYVFALQFTKNKLVLDIACGTGYGSYYLAEQGATLVVGSDASAVALNYAKKYKRQNLLFTLSNALKMPYPDDSFDVVVSYETIEHIEQDGVFLAECARVLKGDGLFLCSTPNKAISVALRGHKENDLGSYHVREYYREEFFDVLSRYFDEVQRFGQKNRNLLLIKTLRLCGVPARWIPSRRTKRNLLVSLGIGKDMGAKRGSDAVNFADALFDEYAVTSCSNNCSYLVAACRKCV